MTSRTSPVPFVLFFAVVACSDSRATSRDGSGDGADAQGGGGGQGGGGSGGTGGTGGDGGSGGGAGGSGGGAGGDAAPDGVACGSMTCAPGQTCCTGCGGAPTLCTTGPCPGPPCPLACPKGDECPMGMLCEWDVATKGCEPVSSTVGGTCAEVPTSCTKEKAPVCGCDGKTYDNDCLRRMGKVQRLHFGPCTAPCGPIPSCPMGLECLGCDGGGPTYHHVCSTKCVSDADCKDAARPKCHRDPSAATGFCGASSLVCCWGCQ